MAREHNVPAYTVLHDASLLEIANRMPASTAALIGIPGIGAVKLERYGPAILEVVRAAQDSSSAATASPRPDRQD